METIWNFQKNLIILNEKKKTVKQEHPMEKWMYQWILREDRADASVQKFLLTPV